MMKQPIQRSSLSQMFFKIGVLKNFAKFTRKHLCKDVARLKACNFVKKRLQHRHFLVKFAKFSKTPLLTASEFCIDGCVTIVSNIRCISNQCIKVSMYDPQYYVAFIPRSCPTQLVNGSSKKMLAHALLSLLVFKHGIIFDFFFFMSFFFLMVQ